MPDGAIVTLSEGDLQVIKAPSSPSVSVWGSIGRPGV